jgi:membrane protein DedA with SNARE-associated domain
MLTAIVSLAGSSAAILNVGQLVETFGYPLLFAAVAAESSGVPVPGETGLITAAVLASRGKMQIELVIAIAAVAAIEAVGVGLRFARRR